MNIGMKIQQIRKANGMNQEQFAERFSVTRQTVSNWENNKNYPDMETLRLISEEYGVSFDVLLKDDTELLWEIDKTRKKVSMWKKILIGAVIALLVPMCVCSLLLYQIAKGTDDKDRINTDTDIKMWVELPSATVSRAITYTIKGTDESSKVKKKIEKAEKKVLGKIEGDIPAIFTNTNPVVAFHFQDLDYMDINSVEITGVKAEITDAVTERTTVTALDYTCDAGVLNVKFSNDFISYGDEETWYQCVITIEYVVDNEQYTGVTAVTLMEDDEIAF